MTETQNPDGSFVRSITLGHVCEVHQGHSHEVDHWMTVAKGAARVTVCQPDERRVPITEVELRPGNEPFLVKAELWHTWKALEDDTQVDCTFPNGERRSFTGSLEAVS